MEIFEIVVLPFFGEKEDEIIESLDVNLYHSSYESALYVLNTLLLDSRVWKVSIKSFQVSGLEKEGLILALLNRAYSSIVVPNSSKVIISKKRSE
jgi:hypothetical protein